MRLSSMLDDDPGTPAPAQDDPFSAATQRLSLRELLRSVGLHPPGVEEDSRAFLKMRCPFHDRPSGRTLWVSTATGAWACHSDRCAHQRAEALPKLLMLRGLAGDVAAVAATQVDLRKDLLSDAVKAERSKRDDLIRDAHIIAWGVDWALAQQVLAAASLEYQRRSLAGRAPDLAAPLETWCHVPAARGSVEHDAWQALHHLLVQRKLEPAALDLFDVGCDRRLGCLTFPLRAPNGELRGVARRAPRAGAPYVVGATLFVPEDGSDYKYAPTQLDDVLWGWYEQRDRIAAGARITIVEGYVDAARLVGWGEVAVAKRGRVLTDAQAALLRSVPNPKIGWPDYDTPGLRDAPKDVVRDLVGIRWVGEYLGVKDAGDETLAREVALRAIDRAVSGTEFLVRLQTLRSIVG